MNAERAGQGHWSRSMTSRTTYSAEISKRRSAHPDPFTGRYDLLRVYCMYIPFQLMSRESIFPYFLGIMKIGLLCGAVD
jgi:hypothetical protein